MMLDYCWGTRKQVLKLFSTMEESRVGCDAIMLCAAACSCEKVGSWPQAFQFSNVMTYCKGELARLLLRSAPVRPLENRRRLCGFARDGKQLGRDMQLVTYHHEQP